MTARHDYISTACHHGACGSCRNTCKFCDEPCQHACHPRAAVAQPSQTWIDQAREIAAGLLLAATSLPPELDRRIRTDPALFWLRGEVQPDGTWR